MMKRQMELLGVLGLICLFVGMFLVSIFILCFSGRCKIRISIIMFFSLFILILFVYLSPALLKILGVISPVSNVTTDQLESDIGISDFYILNAKKHNAAALGFASTASIVFTSETRDTVSHDELVGVGFHEKGHLVYYHSLLQILVGGFLYFGILFWSKRLFSPMKYIFLCCFFSSSLSRKSIMQIDRLYGTINRKDL